MNSFLKSLAQRLERKKEIDLTNPVLVYQMGKVASYSIYLSLRSIEGVNVFHIHRLNSDNIAAFRLEQLRRGVTPPNKDLGIYLFENLIAPRMPAKIISLIREPIGRNISAYFDNLETFGGLKDTGSYLEIDELIENFMRRYHHDVPLKWFDVELKSTVGIDVFEFVFPKELGFQTISHGPYELLLMRHDLHDDVKAGLVSDFLNIQSFSIMRENVGISKEYGLKYKAFLDVIKVPSEYAERMLRSKYAQHFFSDEELSKIRHKWTNS